MGATSVERELLVVWPKCQIATRALRLNAVLGMTQTSLHSSPPVERCVTIRGSDLSSFPQLLCLPSSPCADAAKSHSLGTYCRDHAVLTLSCFLLLGGKRKSNFCEI